MRTTFFIGVIAVALITPASANPRVQSDYVGFWELTFDEDGTPKDTMEIRADGTYVAHGWTCQAEDVIPYHLHNGDMYATIEIPNKGPVSIVFRLLDDGRISFTSPRSGKNAFYSRLEQNPCPGKKAH